MNERIGIYSGTFDPVHQGHVAFAKKAMRQCALNRVVFLPERNPRGKQKVTDVSHRTTLLETAMQSVDGLEVVNLSAERFTVEGIVPELQTLYPGCQFTYLMGSDVVQTLDKWEGIGGLFKEASFAIGMRSSDTKEGVGQIINALQREYSTTIHYTCVDTLQGSLASSQIRDGSMNGLELHPNVLSYIQKEGLYKV